MQRSSKKGLSYQTNIAEGDVNVKLSVNLLEVTPSLRVGTEF